MKILKFTADWCSACKHMSRIINEELSESNKTLIEEIDVDSDKTLDLVKRYSIKSLPTLILVDDNYKELFRHTGTMSRLQLEELINKNI